FANFVNSGRALWGLSSQFSAATNSGPYAYLTGFGGFTEGNQDYAAVVPTAAGAAFGLHPTLTACCWHHDCTAYPGFLQVLATVTTNGGVHPTALGGSVNVPLFTLNCPAPATISCPSSLTVTGQVYNTACQALTVTWRVDGVPAQT